MPERWAVPLRPARPTLVLAVQAFADSIAAFPGKPRSSYGQIGLQTLVPIGASPVSLAVGANIPVAANHFS